MPSPQVEMNDILKGILSNTTRIAETVSKQSTTDSGKITIKDLLRGDISSRSKKLEDITKSTEVVGSALGILKSMKEIDVTSVLKFHALPFDEIAKKIKSFYTDLEGVANSTSVKTAGELVKMTVGMIDMLMKIDPVKMRVKLRMFPTESVTRFVRKFFIGQGNIGKPGGILGALIDVRRVLNTHFKTGQTKTLMENVKNVQTSVLSMVSIVKTTMAVGLLAIPAAVLVPLGITAITGTIHLISKTSNLIKSTSKKFTKASFDAVKRIGLYVVVASSTVFLSTAVGTVISKPGMVGTALKGFGAIAVTTLLIATLSKGISAISKPVKTSMKDIGAILLFITGSASIVLMSYGISKLLTRDVIGQTFIGLGAIMLTSLAVVGISKLVGSSTSTTWKGVLGFVPIVLICAASAAMVIGASKIGADLDWKHLGLGLAGMGTVIVAMAGVAAISAAALTYSWLGLAGFVPIGLIAFASIAMTKNAATMSKEIDKSGGVDNLVAKVKGIGAILSTLVSNVASISLIKIAKATASIPAVLGMMKATSMMADIVSKFETDGEKMKIVRFDNNGNVRSSQEVNVVHIATNIGVAMKNFSTEILNGLSKAETPSNAKKKVKLITSMMEPVSRFTDIVSKFSTGKDGVIKTLELGEDGRVISEKEVNIKKVGDTIASGMINFVSTIAPALKKMDELPSISSPNMFKDDPAEKLKDAVNVIVKFNKTISDVKLDQAKADQFHKMNTTFISTMNDTFKMYGTGMLTKSTQKQMTTFVKQHVEYIDKMTKALEKNKTPFREYVDTLKEFTAEMERIKPVLEEGRELILKIDKSTVSETVNNYKMEGKDFERLAEAFQDPVRRGVKEGCQDLTLTPDGNWKFKNEKLTSVGGFTVD